VPLQFTAVSTATDRFEARCDVSLDETQAASPEATITQAVIANARKVLLESIFITLKVSMHYL